MQAQSDIGLWSLAAQVATVVMGLLAGLSAIIALISAYRLQQQRTESVSAGTHKLESDVHKIQTTLQEELTILRQEIRESREQVQRLETTMAVHLEKQLLINQITTNSLESLAKRLERHEEEHR